MIFFLINYIINIIKKPHINICLKKKFLNKNFQHFYYFFIKLPQIGVFNNSYFILKNIHFKKSNSPKITFVLIFVIFTPSRIFVKFITGFNYISIKLTLNLITNLINVLKFDFDSYNAVCDNLIFDLYSFHINNTIFIIQKYYIYWDNSKIIFNPFGDFLKIIFKDSENLKNHYFLLIKYLI